MRLISWLRGTNKMSAIYKQQQTTQAATKEEPTPFAIVSKAIAQGRNVFISGVGGCGKSYLLKQLYDAQRKSASHSCILCSTTGISAFNLGGITLHSWTKIIIPSNVSNAGEWAQKLVQRLKRRSDVVKKYKSARILFIDEVSMLGANYLDLFNYVCQELRSNAKPFGGIQLVLGGDMMQLPPVNDDFPFESASWEQLNLMNFCLTKAWRFDNQRWVDLLHRARLGQLNDEDKSLLQSRLIGTNVHAEGSLAPIFLSSRNETVDQINRRRLDEISANASIFTSTDQVEVEDPLHPGEFNLIQCEIPEDASKNFLVDKTITLKVGCQVMLLANLCVEDGLTNGTRGIVRAIHHSTIIDNAPSIVVDFETTRTSVSYYAFRCEHKDTTYVRNAIPLKLAYATSIHKSQSLTLSSVEVDIGMNVFCQGQSYVALSRCKSLEGLYLRNLALDRIKPHHKALKFEESFLQSCVKLC